MTQETMMHVGVRLSSDLAPEDLVAGATAAEGTSLSRCWLADNPYERSALITATALARECPALPLGIGVIPIRDRHPVTLAKDAASFAGFLTTPAILGFGVGVSDRDRVALGLPRQSGLGLLEETLRISRALLGGELIASLTEGDDATISLKVAPEPIPLVVGAVGPKTLRLSARLADGVVFSNGVTLGYLEKAVAIVHGKDGGAPPTFRTTAYLLFGGDITREQARATIKPAVAGFLAMAAGRPEYAWTLDGLSLSIDEAGEIAEAVLTGGDTEAMSDDVMDELSLWGSASDCAARLSRYRDVGLTEVALSVGRWTRNVPQTVADAAEIARAWNATRVAS